MGLGVYPCHKDGHNGYVNIFTKPDPVIQRLVALGFDRVAATHLSRRGTVVDIASDTMLCQRGERGTQAFLLLEGEANVVTDSGVISVGPGAVIGELATLDPHRTRNATVVTSTATRVLVFDVATFRFLAQRDDLRARLAPERAAA